MRIYMHQLPFRWIKDTDYYMVENFKKLGCVYPDLEFVYPKNLCYSLLANIVEKWNICLNKATRRFKRNFTRFRFRPITQRFLSFDYRSDQYDYVFMRESDYVNIEKCYKKKGTKVFLEALFIDPLNMDGEHWKALQNNWSKQVEFIRECSCRDMIINLRSDYSVKLARQMFPEAKAKFVNLFFPIDNRNEHITEEQLRNKHLNMSDTDELHFLICGKEAKRKGLVNLMEAFVRLRCKYGKRVVLTVISGQAKTLFPDIENMDGVIYRGAVSHDEALQEFSKSHVYVMPSLYETFGLSYVEGLAHGCVVIARDFEPQREILNYGKAGFLVNPFEMDSIYEAMESVVRMKNEERMQIAKRGYDRFINKYHFDVVSKAWHDTLATPIL